LFISEKKFFQGLVYKRIPREEPSLGHPFGSLHLRDLPLPRGLCSSPDCRFVVKGEMGDLFGSAPKYASKKGRSSHERPEEKQHPKERKKKRPKHGGGQRENKCISMRAQIN